MTRGRLPFLPNDAGRKPGPGGYQVAWKGSSMAELIAIGYPEEATAQQARDEVSQQLDRPTRREPSSATVREASGSPPTRTGWLSGSSGECSWGCWPAWASARAWEWLLAAALGRLSPRSTGPGSTGSSRAGSGGMLKPGTSTLVVLVNKGITDTVAEALSRHGGTILESSLSADARVATPGGPTGTDHQINASPLETDLQHGSSGGCLALTPATATASCPHAATLDSGTSHLGSAASSAP